MGTLLDINLHSQRGFTFSGDLTLPRSLQCGGFQDQILQAVLWFSSGGTKSVLHNDLPDNVNCILDGNKDIIFIDKVRCNVLRVHRNMSLEEVRTWLTACLNIKNCIVTRATR